MDNSDPSQFGKTKSNSSILLIVAALLLVLLCCFCLCAAIALGYFGFQTINITSTQIFIPPAAPTSLPQVIRPTAQPVLSPTLPEVPTYTMQALAGNAPAATEVPPEATPTPGRTPVLAQVPTDTLNTLEKAVVPTADLIDLAEKLQGKQNISATLPPPPSPYQVGDHQSFWASNEDENNTFQVQATLRYVTPHSYWWIQDGVSYRASDLSKLADTFENKIYPTDREFFGSEWSPGIDDDVHLYVLYAKGLGSSVVGYFYPIDEYPPAAQKYSNAHEMFYLNADASTGLRDPFTYGVLAHEFQHMIHWYRDSNETTWINEGFSDLAMFLNGYDIGGADIIYSQNPDTQLDDWPVNPKDDYPNYGASFLFLTYFLDRFKETATQALVADPLNGLEGIDDVLAKIGTKDSQTGKSITADDIFLDWVVANYLHDPSVADGRYTYHDYQAAPQTKDTETVKNCPTGNDTRQVHQYAVNYISIQCSGDYTLHFEGSTQVGVIPENAHSGSYAIWSNKGDSSDMTLTHAFDFTNVSGPLTFTYWTWYDIEKDFDYVYLEYSLDGKDWTILTTPSGTSDNPIGNSYGWGYTGTSGGSPQWIQEKVDISQLAGEKAQLRFEYVTDAVVNGEGFLLDDASIPQINYASNFERDDGGWQGDGFVRMKNVLPQKFGLTLITMGRATTVQRIPVSPEVTADISLHIGGDVREAVLVVSGLTRFTRQEAAYRFTISH
jgi:immune inhibitor A